LLRGACHRARIRATRWLAMTASKRATLSTVIARLDRAIQYSGASGPGLQSQASRAVDNAEKRHICHADESP
jgi:hypothetical protein